MEQKPSEAKPASNPLADIVRKGSVITVITLISRPIGYVREAIQAYLFGATLLVDAFIIAFNFPELVQTLFFSGATSAFLVPVCTKYMKNEREYSEIYSTFINLSLLITFFVSLLLLLFSSGIVKLIAPGFSPEARGVTMYLFIIMIPVITFHTLLSIMKAFLNAREHFAAPEMSGLLWNVAFIVFALTLSRKWGIYSLAVGATVGSALQILMQLPYTRKLHIQYRPVISFAHPAIKEARNLFTGALIATSIVPVNSFVGRIIASYLPHGEVASLSYAFRIFILPFSLFAVPVYTVMFSKISRLFHEKKWEDIRSHIDSSMVLLFISLIPCTVLLCTLGETFVEILYQRGAFTAADTSLTGKALFGYGIGLLFYALSLSFVRIFNAMHDMKTPALVGLTSIALNAILAYSLMTPFKNLGISLATSAVSLYNFLFLYILLKKRVGYKPGADAVRKIAKSLFAGFVAFPLILFAKGFFHHRAYPSLAAGIILTVIVYGIFFRSYFQERLRRKLRFLR
ncbi:MAG TPA: murein biosynthesis integral membrane protein MurJ [Syntrophorhabdaceae bacterium]